MAPHLRLTRAASVTDLGFGDAGKGLLVDALVRRLGARRVVRWNGGAQAGHNVVTPDGRHHTFAQIGAGAFVAGVETWLGPGVVVHPTALGVEARHLAAAGIPDPLARVVIHRDCPVVTPFHQAANRLRELARGPDGHGTCGVGVGEAATAARRGAGLRAGQIEGLAEAPLRALRDAIREGLGDVVRAARARAGDAETLARVEHEVTVIEDPTVSGAWRAAARGVFAAARLGDDDGLVRAVHDAPVVFEGAQGVLLDETWGFHPYTTWSDTTPAFPKALCPDVVTLGVLRTYGHRHGPGPLPGEDPTWRLAEPHNDAAGWQGPFRRGPFDAVRARYALRVCAAADAPVDGLVLTHLDALHGHATWPLVIAWYPRSGDFGGAARLTDLPLVAPDPHGVLASRIARVDVERVDVPLGSDPVEAWTEAVGNALGVPIVATSHGPTADHLRLRAQRTSAATT